MDTILEDRSTRCSALPLLGKKALVIGGSRGIGAAIVARLAQDGAEIAFTYRGSADAAQSLAASLNKGLAIQADSGDEAALSGAVEHAARHMGGIDILVYNAGVLVRGGVDELSLADFDRTYAVNVRGAFIAVQAASRHLPEGGRIVFIGSNAAERSSFPGAAAYVMSKSAIGGLARGLSQDFAPRGITVNTIQPGPTATDMNPQDGPMAGAIRGFVPLGRFGEPAEIGALVAHVAGPEAGFITGAAFTIDGGFSV